MKLFTQKDNNSAKCPACGGFHPVIKPLPNELAEVIVCQFIPDIIYLNRTVADFESRKVIREKIFGG